MKNLRFLYFLRIAALPGLVVLGFFVQIFLASGAPEEPLAFLHGLFSAAVMMAVSVLYIFKLRVLKAPKTHVGIYLALLQLPVLVGAQAYFGAQPLNFWEGCYLAFFIESQGLLLVQLYFTFIQPLEKPMVGERGLAGLVIIPLLLYPFTDYGLWAYAFWSQAGWLNLALALLALALDAYFFAQSERNRDWEEEPEAYQSLGREFLSGLILVPVWGTFLFLYPLAFLL